MTADLDQLVVDCQAALAEPRPQPALKEVLDRLVRRRSDLLEALPAPRQQMTVIHVSSHLTIFQLVNAPGFAFHAHDHGCWSAVAFYSGRERNTFYRRIPNGVVASGGREYDAGDVTLMGAEVIHAIENPSHSNNAALHVFAGNPFTAQCSQWDSESLAEAPFDSTYAQAVYPVQRLSHRTA